jgi:hypothetical protein
LLLRTKWILNGQRKKEREMVPDIAYRSFEREFQRPSSTEGFAEIVTVEFVPEFASPEEEKLFTMFLS